MSIFAVRGPFVKTNRIQLAQPWAVKLRGHTQPNCQRSIKNPRPHCCPCGSCRPGKCHSRTCRAGVNRPGDKFSSPALQATPPTLCQPRENTAFVAHHRCRIRWPCSSRRWPNDTFVAPQCVGSKDRTHWSQARPGAKHLPANCCGSLGVSLQASAFLRLLGARVAECFVFTTPRRLPRVGRLSPESFVRLNCPTGDQKPASLSKPCDFPQSSCVPQFACHASGFFIPPALFWLHADNVFASKGARREGAIDQSPQCLGKRR